MQFYKILDAKSCVAQRTKIWVQKWHCAVHQNVARKREPKKKKSVSSLGTLLLTPSFRKQGYNFDSGQNF
jgi:hypothetical protein